MNATNNLNDRKASNTLTRLAPIERMEMEGLEATSRLIALPFFVITFSMTALVALSIYHFRLTEQQHGFAVALTSFLSVSMLIGSIAMIKGRPRTLLIYSIVCAFILGAVAPLTW